MYSPAHLAWAIHTCDVTHPHSHADRLIPIHMWTDWFALSSLRHTHSHSHEDRLIRVVHMWQGTDWFARVLFFKTHTFDSCVERHTTHTHTHTHMEEETTQCTYVFYTYMSSSHTYRLHLSLLHICALYATTHDTHTHGTTDDTVHICLLHIYVFSTYVPCMQRHTTHTHMERQTTQCPYVFYTYMSSAHMCPVCNVKRHETKRHAT